jgi:AmiR/NasT family two-component response regulator
MIEKPVSVLIVTGTGKGAEAITQLLDHTIFTPISAVRSGSEARQKLISHSYDIIIINTPLTDEFGTDLAEYIMDSSNSGTILIVKNEIYDNICTKVEDLGILTVGKPLQKQIFNQTIKLLVADRNRIIRFQNENEKLQTKIEEIKIVSRAKCILVEYLRMNEAQAHRYIEKQAMDMRTSKKNIAESILKTYDV